MTESVEIDERCIQEGYAGSCRLWPAQLALETIIGLKIATTNRGVRPGYAWIGNQLTVFLTGSSMLNSYAHDLGAVRLPQWASRNRYMHTFETGAPVMAPGFEDYLQVVTGLCAAASVSGTAHMTVDEAVVAAGMSQRRPGAHVDGCFVPTRQGWTHGGGSGGWQHYHNSVPGGQIPRMAVIVAASVAGCRIWEGRFEGEPKENGDLEHIRSQLGPGRLLASARAWLLSPDCVHESVRFTEPTKRTFLRIAFERTGLEARA